MTLDMKLHEIQRADSKGVAPCFDIFVQRVPGGWVYIYNGNMSQTTSFVPEPPTTEYAEPSATSAPGGDEWLGEARRLLRLAEGDEWPLSADYQQGYCDALKELAGSMALKS